MTCVITNLCSRIVFFFCNVQLRSGPGLNQNIRYKRMGPTIFVKILGPIFFSVITYKYINLIICYLTRNIKWFGYLAH